MRSKTDSNQQRQARSIVYRALLNHHRFSNPDFWSRLAEYEDGRLVQRVFDVAEKLIFSEGSFTSLHLRVAVGGALIYTPRLDDLVLALYQDIESQDHPKLCQIMKQSLRPDYERSKIEGVLDRLFSGVRTSLDSGANDFSIYRTERKSPLNPYPGFLGHPDFQIPAYSYQSQLTSHFCLSVLMISAGVVALVVAFAYLQAAAMALAGVAAATVGTAAILGGLALFRANRNKIIYNNKFIDRELERDWRPTELGFGS